MTTTLTSDEREAVALCCVAARLTVPPCRITGTANRCRMLPALCGPNFSRIKSMVPAQPQADSAHLRNILVE